MKTIFLTLLTTIGLFAQTVVSTYTPGYGVPVTVNTFGAVGDGTTDDTTAIQSALDHCLTNDCTVVLQSGKTYVAAGLILGRHAQSQNANGGRLVGQFGSKLKLKANAGTFLLWVGMSSVSTYGSQYNVVSDIIFDGNKANNGSTAYPVIRVHNAQYSRFQNLRVINAPQDAVLTDSTASGVEGTIYSLWNTWSDVFISAAARDGFVWKQDKGTIVHGLHVHDSGRHNVSCGVNENYSHFEQNTLTNFNISGATEDGILLDSGVARLTIADGMLYANAGYGIRIAPVTATPPAQEDIKISGVTVRNSTLDGIYVTSPAKLIQISDSYFQNPNATSKYGVKLEAVSGVTLTSLIFSNYGKGIKLATTASTGISDIVMTGILASILSGFLDIDASAGQSAYRISVGNTTVNACSENSAYNIRLAGTIANVKIDASVIDSVRVSDISTATLSTNVAFNNQYSYYSILDTSSTPSIFGRSFWIANESSRTYTDFLGGAPGSVIDIMNIYQSSVVLKHDNAKIVLRSGADTTLAAGKTIRLIYTDSAWREVFISQ